MANEEKLRDYLKLATAELVQVRRRLAEIESGEQEPIAVVGMACHFPGGVRSPGEFWELLASGSDAISGFPVDRGWDVEALYDPNPDQGSAGTSYTRHGGFLHDAADFDAEFFGISPREALAMDPQQRLLLETSWEALEGAGIAPATLRGSRTGVFAGMMYHDYATRLLDLPDDLEGLVGNGNAGGVLSGRLSYSFGFEGPAVTVDTACSSSLVALHLACQSLRSGECSLALAGGVTVMSTPGVFVEFSRQRGLAADGRCKPYAAAADGVGMSEGVAVLLVERLSDARRLGHRVLAVVRGSAVNQDGASNGLTAPNGPSQQRVIRQALAAAGLATAEIDAVEGHGTGTTLGDPIEAQALLSTYGQDRAEDRPLWLGSVKSNIGHTQAAAGVAGVIKMVLALRNGLLPSSLHAEDPTPHVDWSAGRVRLLSEAVPWPGDGRPRRAGVSSFGVSGTNAHVILEQAPDEAVAEGEFTAESPVVPCVVSARSEGALRGQARRLREFIADQDAGLTDVAHALVAERAVFEHRAVIVAEDREELVRGLDALSLGAPAPQLVESLTERHDTDEPTVAVLFTGQGSQRVGMGREMYAAFPAFAAAFDAVCAEITTAGGPDVRKLLFTDDVSASEQCTRTEFAQPALFALEVALYRLAETSGIRPRFLLGHSVGELVAAHVAGVLSLPDAARLVVSRGRLMQALPEGGAMVAVEISEREARQLLAEAETDTPGAARVDLAAVNGPRSVVLSGDGDAVRELARRCAERDCRTRRLKVSHAFHSSLMDEMLEEFRQDAERVTYHPARIPVVSNATGAPLPAEEFGTPGYWVRHAREAVRFGDGVAWLRDQGVRTFLELGPDGTLCGLGQDAFATDEPATDAEEPVMVPALRPDRGESQTFLAALARLFVSGVEVDWPRAMGWAIGVRGGVELPTYAFDRKRYWLEGSKARGSGAGGVEGPLWEAVERGDVPRVGALLGVDEGACLGTLVPALGTWWRGCRDRGVLDGWRYREVWRPVGDGGPGAPTGRWLVVAADGVDGSPVVEELERSGARAARHAVEEGVAREALVERLRADLGPEPEVDGVVLLLAGDGGRSAGALLLTWLQALGDLEVAARLWCVTHGAVSVGGGDELSRPGLGQVWGLGRVAAIEAPEVWGGLVDVPGPMDARAARSVVRLLAGPERECAVRASGVFVRRLERAPHSGAEPGPEWRPHGTVLITGGTGGLGAHVARWLSGRGPVHLLLLSRRGEAAEGAAELRDELTGLGAQVTVAACDVADRAALTEVLAGVAEDAPLTAVVHAAGALDDAVLATLTPERLEAARQAKAVGAWQLHELTRGADLAAFVVFSSVAATFGSAGQGGYAAANAEVDALIRHRRGLGLPGLSVAWGAWAGDGMADAASDAGRLRRHGMAAMDPQLALTALGQALEHDETCLTIADIDWRTFVDHAPATGLDPLIGDIPEARAAWEASGRGTAEAVGTLRARLAGLPVDEQTRVLGELVRTHAATVLGHVGPAAVPPERAFRELGFDSLTAVELRNRLNAATGLRLPATAVFDYPHPAALAHHTWEQLFGAPGQAGVLSPADPRPTATDEPIAVVGMACRFPGGVRSAEEFWELLAQGKDAIAGFPMDRGWDVESLYDPDPERPGTSYARAGGFLYDATDFDAGFFGISPREALAMDPQQRLLLETSWETFEKAGIDPAGLRGSSTGVFAGIAQQDYADLLRRAGEDLEGYALTGVSGSALSGRLSYSFGFEGPAVTVDTACSSSLVALHLACQSLRSGECSLALAGGVTVMSTPGVFVEFSRQRGLATDGRCKPYATEADGVGWSEGVGMVLVERLSDARRLGHRVLAVVRGSAVNQDGASNGLTAPNGPSQQRVIRQALAAAGLVTAEIDAVEGHGTGTTLGDPIEAQALLSTYGQDRAEDRPLWLGSVKSNIGHTQAAAGVAGVIKMVLALEHETLPPSLHANTPTPHVDWTAGQVRLLSEAVPWPRDGRPRRAGVSSFGVSGTNAHVILEQAPDEAVAEGEFTAEPPVVPCVVSARSEGALRGQARRLREFIADQGAGLTDVAHALVAERAVFERRAVIVAEDREELVRALEALATGDPAAGLVEGQPGSAAHGRVAMLFGGQGTQWDGMAAELLDTAPVFAEQMTACAEALAPHVEWSLLDVVRSEPDAPPLDRVDVVQPVLFAVMVSLAALWRSYGVRPAAVAGHSQGEIAAAYVAGALSLEDAARIVALRSQVLSELAGSGAMLSVGMSAPELEPRLAPWGERLCVAAVNGAASAVVSGTPEAVDALLAELTADGVRARRLKVDWASHSPQVEAIHERLLTLLAPIRPRTGDIPLYSTVTGERVDGSELDAEYWYRNLRQMVRFQDATRALVEDGHTVFIESGPHPAVSVGVQETLDALGATDTLVLGTLRRDEGGLSRFLTSLARLFVSGGAVDWSPAVGPGAGRRGGVDLPTYAFERNRFWLEPAPGGAVGGDVAQGADEPLWAAVRRGDVAGVGGLLGVGEGASLAALVSALEAWRQGCRDRETVDGLRYREVWRPAGAGGTESFTGRWLVVAPDGSRRALVEGLERAGARVVRVPAEPGPDGHTALVDRLRGESDTEPEVKGLVLIADDEMTVSLLPAVAQALGDLDDLGGWGAGARLWCVTSGAVSLGGDDAPASRAQARVWDTARRVGLEAPGLWGGLVDVPDETDGPDVSDVPDRRTVDGLIGVLHGNERECAVRASGVFVRRWARAPLAGAVAEREWRPQGTVLISGGTDGPGAHTARWLAANGAEHLLLLDEHGDGFGIADELSAMGPRVTVAECDPADRSALADLLTGIPDELPLRAVVHTAQGDDGIATAWHLHELTRDADLSAFVVFSPAAPHLGAVGHDMCAEVAALTHHRRVLGLPGLAMACGAWAADGDEETGPAGSQASSWRRRGVTAMDPRLALEALKQALDHGETCLTAADIDWRRLVETEAADRLDPVFREIPEAREAWQLARGDGGGEPADTLRARLAGLDPARQRRALLELVRTHAAAVLGHDGPAAVPPERAFRELGFDSLTAVELRNRLNIATGLPLPTTAVFDHPNSTALALGVWELLFDGAAAAGSGAAPAREAVATDEPIAVVGMACRFPGGVRSAEEFWELLAQGKDAIAEFPADRGWDVETLYDPDPERPGTSYARAGGFLYDAADFDAGFFGISPREALAMDPQQRLLLETSWEALERAGIDPTSLRGSRTGVFAGLALQDYTDVVRRGGPELEGYALTGVSGSVLSGRLAYTFGFEGPAVTVDTACSSSLVAMHLASQSLRSGECSLALAGGATVMSTPAAFVEFSRQRGLAADGRCKAYAAEADGVGWSEGVGVVLLERLSDARRHGHRVLAVVRGSAMNQDGASNGLTAPNGPAQQRVIRQALANAGIAATDIDAVEGHGTGTTLGDPIEAQAILATYGRDRPADSPLWLGSVKSNIGHTQAAAGVAGVIKMVLALQHDLLPASRYADAPSPHVDWSSGRVRLLSAPVPWPCNGHPRRAGISSFGVSGTNAHVILEQAPDEPALEDVAAVAVAVAVDERPGEIPPPAVPWVISARTESALRGQARRLGEFTAGDADHAGLVDVARALATERAVFERRAVIVAEDREELVRGLAALAAGDLAPGLVTGSPPPGSGSGSDGGLAMLFAGQGTQRVGMGRELAAAFPAYARALDAVLTELDGHLDRPLRALLFAAPGTDEAALLDRTRYAQPALFAVEVALFRLLESFGVRPDFLVGHSLGELAAAHVAGVLTLPDAALLVAARGRLMQQLPPGGAMVALRATEGEVTEALAGREAQVSVAAVNGPGAVVVSGERSAVDEVAAAFAARGRKTRRLRVGHAFHSPLMEPMLDEFRQVAASLTYAEPAIGMVSNLTGELARPGELTDPEYWVRHVRHAVRFGDGLAWLRANGASTFLELGPDGTLSALAHDRLDDDPATEPTEAAAAVSAETAAVVPVGGPVADGGRIVSAPALRPDRPEAHTLLTALARIHVHGVAVDWSAVIGPRPAGADGRRRVELPTYAFDRRRYWPRTHERAADLSAAGLAPADHPLLGSAVELAGSQELLFTGRLSLRTHPWLADHVIFDTVLLPGTAILELAFRAGDEAGYDRVEELALQIPLVLPERGSVVLQLLLGVPDAADRRPFTLSSRLDDGPRPAADTAWTCHATGVLTRGGDPLGGPAAPAEHEVTEREAAEAWPPPDATPVDLTTWYADLAGVGLGYGPAFQGLRAAWRRGDELFAEVGLDEEQAADAVRYALHPALLDAALHPVALGLDTTPGPGAEERGRLPFSWGGVTVGVAGASTLRVRLTAVAQDTIALRATDGSGRLVAQARSLAFRPITAERLRAVGTAYHEALFRLEWTPRQAAPAASARQCRWALVGPEVPGLAGALDAAGAAWRAYPHLAALGEAVPLGGPAPDMVVISCREQDAGRQDLPGDRHDPTPSTAATAATTATAGTAGTATALRQATNGVLELLLSWLGDERFADCRLTLVTHGAVAATRTDTVADLAYAPVWGLVRSAQSEHPDRFVLADTDGRPESQRTLPEALLTGEPQIALRDGTVHLPRVARVAVTTSPTDHEDAPTPADADVDTVAIAQRTWDPDGTVLITGGTGVLGRLLARHLVTAHGVRHLLLTGRRGPDADGVPELLADLARLGADDATVRACDMADRHAVAGLLSGIPARHPLSAVIHLAGVVDDGILTSLTPQRVDAVLGPKAIGALNLHELTRAAALDAFVVFSSAAASFGSPGQGNYTAANAFLDALMRHRRALGLPGQSLAWGMWAQASGMTEGLGATDRARMARGGLAPLTDEQGLALLDTAGTVDEAVLLATPLDFRALRAQAAAGALPPILRGLVRVPARRAAAAADAAGATAAEAPAALRARLAGLPGPAERTGALLELVRTQAAAVLGHGAAETVDAEGEFRELGFDSLTAVELRNRLAAATGLRLATTLVFDHPSPAALARHMAEQLAAEADDTGEHREQPAAGRAYGPVHREGPSAATVESLFWVGHDTGRIHEAMQLLSAASVFRPAFGATSAETAPTFVRLAHATAPDTTPRGETAEPSQPMLICLPTVAAISSAYQYSRFAAALQGVRDVWYAPAPGFLEGEPLPADVDAVTRVLAEAVVRFTDGAPFALAGHSAGGWLTYCVTSHLEGLGVLPEAAVAMDAYLPDEGIAPVASALTSEIFNRVTEFVEVDYTRLTAMGGYFRIFSGWTPPRIETPTLFIRGRDGEQSPPAWGVPHTVMDVAGDHFTMLEEYAGDTARHVDQWLRESAGWGG
ncbi:type I polyketide synthase [Streptomyces sp. NPDC021225]|uniref:type I polyketide synthase n=1 Tax=Streptomyces sp. NPDC021225 TaxID=3365121 RepID=UPI003788FEE3